MVEIIKKRSNVEHMRDLDELEERFENLLSLGKQIEGTSKSVDITIRPVYLNEERFKRAQGTIQKYFANLSMGSSTGLLLLVQLDSILIPLLRTGKSRTICDLHDRYIMTAEAIRKYYETNFYDKSSEGWKYISLIRSMHQRIHQMMQNDKERNEPGILWVNQYDMALTQFAFIGLFLLRPEKCGAYKTSKQELEDITYYWRILSYYLGIEERFNLFVYDEDMEKQTQFLTLMLNHIKELLQKSRNQVGLAMAEGITLAFEDFAKESSFNILDHWWSPDISLSGLNDLKSYSFMERFKVLLFLFYFDFMFKSDKLRWWSSDKYRAKFIKFVETGDQNKRKLAKKYSHITYEENVDGIQDK